MTENVIEIEIDPLAEDLVVGVVLLAVGSTLHRPVVDPGKVKEYPLRC